MPVHHIAFSAKDIDASAAFYDEILKPLGYKRHISEEDFCAWDGVIPEILLYASKKEGSHETYTPGIHHLAFQANERSIVKEVFKKAKTLEAEILNEPDDYPEYGEGYHATFFLDPDGIKIEIAHIP